MWGRLEDKVKVVPETKWTVQMTLKGSVFSSQDVPGRPVITGRTTVFLNDPNTTTVCSVKELFQVFLEKKLFINISTRLFALMT